MAALAQMGYLPNRPEMYFRIPYPKRMNNLFPPDDQIKH